MNSGSRGAFKVGALVLANGVRLDTGTGAPVDGTTGTSAGKANRGSFYFDYGSGLIYQNIGTQASPVWVSPGVQSLEVSISNAEMLAIRATPKTLVVAPGAGKFLELVAALLLFDRTAVYTETADNLQIKYGTGAGDAASETIETTGFVDAATDAIIPVQPVASVVVLKAAGENKALVLHNTGDGEFGGGNAANVVRAKIAYRVWATGF